MKFALVNPARSFEGSIYFGCRDPHLPLEYGLLTALLEMTRLEMPVESRRRGAREIHELVGIPSAVGQTSGLPPRRPEGSPVVNPHTRGSR